MNAKKRAKLAAEAAPVDLAPVAVLDATVVPDPVVETPPTDVAPQTVDLTNLDFIGALGGINLPPQAIAVTKKQKQGPPGVAQNAKTRPYYAGEVIAKYGLAAGKTDAMVAEVDALFGDVNPYQTDFCIRNAWHAIRAYLAAHNLPWHGPATPHVADAK